MNYITTIKGLPGIRYAKEKHQETNLEYQQYLQNLQGNNLNPTKNSNINPPVDSVIQGYFITNSRLGF